ncbi:hypothetical protein ES707_15767 [subsurface metagenome]
MPCKANSLRLRQVRSGSFCALHGSSDPAGLFFLSRKTQVEGHERRIMYRVTFTICCVLLLSSQAVGFAPIGPAASNLEKGQFALGFDYAHSENDFEGKGGSSLLLPEFDVRWNMSSEFGEFETNFYSGKFRYGIAEGSELFVRLGIADSEFAWGVGAKTALLKSPKLDWGIGIQANWLYSEETETLPGKTYIGENSVVEFGPVDVKYETDVMSVQIFTGPVFKFDKLRFYGGPFLSWLKVDGDCKATQNITGVGPGTIWVDVPVSLTYSCENENDFQFGGYIGSSLEIVKNFDLMAELQFTSDGQLFGLGLGYRF